MKKVKVLCVLPSLRICNGVASYAMNYYKNISNIDMDFVVANLDTKSDYFDEIKLLFLLLKISSSQKTYF
jgi:hypothetical protein